MIARKIGADDMLETMRETAGRAFAGRDASDTTILLVLVLAVAAVLLFSLLSRRD